MSRTIHKAIPRAGLAVLAASLFTGAFSQPGDAAATASNEQLEPAAEAQVPDRMTAEQVRAAIEEAEKLRLEELEPDPATSGKLVDDWGVEVIGIRQASAGYMLDFRFRVLDAEKALPLFDHRIKPYVQADGTSIRLPVPMAAKVGAFRPTNRGANIKGDKTYYMLFANPDNYVRLGQKVSVVIGDFRAEHLTVQ
ncbi:MAG: hypothetical protein PVF91_09385 [Chromatiales bacterium]|jgi:hypothetical protein